jgi:hypothetical protein
MALQIFVGLWPPFSCLVFHTVGRTSLTADQPSAKPLPAHTGQQQYKTNAYRHPGLKWDSNPESQCFQREKTVHALHHADIVIDREDFSSLKSLIFSKHQFCLHIYVSYLRYYRVKLMLISALIIFII